MAEHDEFLHDLAWKASRGNANLETFATDYVCDDHVLPSDPEDIVKAFRQAFIDGLRFPALVEVERRDADAQVERKKLK